MTELKSPRTGDSIFVEDHASGLKIMVYPKPGYRSAYAVFGTRYGSVNTRFKADGELVSVPDGIAHFLEHKMFDLPEGDATEQFAAHGGSHGTTGNTEGDQLIERYFTYFKADDTDAMLDLFLPEVITYMQDDDTAAGREAALIQLDDWYYDYGKAIDDYYVYDDDSLDASDVRELQRELGVRIDDNVIVACDVTYQNGQDNDFYFEFVQVDGQWYLLFVVE